MNDKLDLLNRNRVNQKLVFTNGCFDIVHRGHVQYLNEAKALGDILVIGLNSDESVRRLKGQSRPVVAQDDRAFLLTNLKCVDDVFIFEEDTPLNLIKKIRPDILVKGGDWKKSEIVGSKEVLSWGGSVRSLSFVPSFSTTDIIEKINNA